VGIAAVNAMTADQGFSLRQMHGADGAGDYFSGGQLPHTVFGLWFGWTCFGFFSK
jgi:hypothetical protein